MQEALAGVDAAKMYFRRLRSVEEFDHFYTTCVETAEQHSIDQPQLPRIDVAPHDFRMALHLIRMYQQEIITKLFFSKDVTY